jgi:hypothetical protein
LSPTREVCNPRSEISGKSGDYYLFTVLFGVEGQKHTSTTVFKSMPGSLKNLSREADWREISTLIVQPL